MNKNYVASNILEKQSIVTYSSMLACRRDMPITLQNMRLPLSSLSRRLQTYNVGLLIQIQHGRFLSIFSITSIFL